VVKGHTQYLNVLQQVECWTSICTTFDHNSTMLSNDVYLIVPISNYTLLGDRAFTVAAPQAWNRLPTELKLLRSTDLFRRDLKTFLFHSVYGHQDTD